jgi:hypothetical protein
MNTSNDNIVIKEELDEEHDSEEEVKVQAKRSRGDGFEMKFSN